MPNVSVASARLIVQRRISSRANGVAGIGRIVEGTCVRFGRDRSGTLGVLAREPSRRVDAFDAGG